MTIMEMKEYICYEPRWEAQDPNMPEILYQYQVYYPEFEGDNHYGSQLIKVHLLNSGDLVPLHCDNNRFIASFNQPDILQCIDCGKFFKRSDENYLTELNDSDFAFINSDPNFIKPILVKTLDDLNKSLDDLKYKDTGLTPFIVSSKISGSKDAGPMLNSLL